MRSSSEWKGHHGEPAARPQQPLGGGQRLGQFVEFVVDRDAQRLKRPRRRMYFAEVLAGAARAMIVGQPRVVRNGALARSATMARAMRREARSSPK